KTHMLLPALIALTTTFVAVWMAFKVASLVTGILSLGEALVGLEVIESAATITSIIMWAAITAGIILVVAGIAWLVYHFRHQLLGVIESVWKWIKKNWPLLLDILLGPFGFVIGYVIKHFNAIEEVASEVWGWIKKNWPLLLAVLMGPFGIIPGIVYLF